MGKYNNYNELKSVDLSAITIGGYFVGQPIETLEEVEIINNCIKNEENNIELALFEDRIYSIVQSESVINIKNNNDAAYIYISDVDQDLGEYIEWEDTKENQKMHFYTDLENALALTVVYVEKTGVIVEVRIVGSSSIVN